MIDYLQQCHTNWLNKINKITTVTVMCHTGILSQLSGIWVLVYLVNDFCPYLVWHYFHICLALCKSCKQLHTLEYRTKQHLVFCSTYMTQKTNELCYTTETIQYNNIILYQCPLTANYHEGATDACKQFVESQSRQQHVMDVCSISQAIIKVTDIKDNAITKSAMFCFVCYLHVANI